MSIIQWNSLYAVGHGQIDKQHKKIFNLINELYDVIQNGCDLGHARKIADDIVDHAIKHFEFEESILARINYPMLTEHHEEHQRMLAQILDHRGQITTDSQASVVRMLNFLRKWILEHLADSDRDYVLYINDTVQ